MDERENRLLQRLCQEEEVEKAIDGLPLFAYEKAEILKDKS